MHVDIPLYLFLHLYRMLVLYLFVCTQSFIHTFTQRFRHSFTQIHESIHTQIHTYIHTYIHIHSHTHTWEMEVGPSHRPEVRPDGYVRLSDILALDFFRRRGVGEADLLWIVGENEKRRFGTAVPPGETELFIRAHQGRAGARRGVGANASLGAGAQALRIAGRSLRRMLRSYGRG